MDLDETVAGARPTVARRAPAIALWGLRILWLATSLVVADALSRALADRSTAVRLTAVTGWWTVWAAVLLALLVPSTVGLTALRLLAPLGVVAAVGAWIEGAGAALGFSASGLTGAAVLVAFSAEVAERLVQGSAYGDESRFPLRPPAPWLAPTVLAWLVVAVAAVSGPLLLAARQWVWGVPVSVAAVGLAIVLPRRFHRLSRRWLVLVPAGVVLHDPILLGETLMVPRRGVAGLSLAPAGSEAADLTGPTWGTPVELRLRDLVTVVLAPTATAPQGAAIHARATLIAPSRPGQALGEAARRRITAP